MKRFLLCVIVLCLVVASMAMACVGTGPTPPPAMRTEYAQLTATFGASQYHAQLTAIAEATRQAVP